MRRLLFVAPLLVAGTALAHQGVTNPAVMARMQSMTTINDAMKVLSAMVKAETDFDAAAATAARDQLLTQTRTIPDLFSSKETDPKSEARLAIWSDP